MSQDVVSDALNQIMNVLRVERNEVVIKRSSKVLISVLEIMKSKGHIDYSIGEDGLKIKIIKLNFCKTIKPRFYAKVSDIDKYLRRYLPSRNFGHIIISTSKGMMTHKDALKNNLGGSLIAYFY